MGKGCDIAYRLGKAWVEDSIAKGGVSLAVCIDGSCLQDSNPKKTPNAKGTLRLLEQKVLSMYNNPIASAMAGADHDDVQITGGADAITIGNDLNDIGIMFEVGLTNDAKNIKDSWAVAMTQQAAAPGTPAVTTRTIRQSTGTESAFFIPRHSINGAIGLLNDKATQSFFALTAGPTVGANNNGITITGTNTNVKVSANAAVGTNESGVAFSNGALTAIDEARSIIKSSKCMC